MARYPRWNASTPRRSSTSSGSGPGMRVAVIDVDDDDDPRAHRRANDRPDRGLARARHGRRPAGADSHRRSSPRSTDLAARIRPNGAIWVVSRKGKAATLRDVRGHRRPRRRPGSSTTRSRPSRRPTRRCASSSRARSGRLADLRVTPTAALPSAMQDLGIVLIVVLVLVLLWRGPKTLPKLGEALGRGVREAKRRGVARCRPRSRPHVGRAATPPTDGTTPDRP